jgi:hypothetical protein
VKEKPVRAESLLRDSVEFPTRHAVFSLVVLHALTWPVFAQNANVGAEELTAAEVAEEAAIAADSDGSLDDATNSINIKKVLDGFALGADIRIAYFESEIDDRDNSSRNRDITIARWRFRTEYGINRYLRVVGRVAGICSNHDCSANVVMEESIPTTSGMSDGDITLDEAYFQWSRFKKLDIALGRMQTKFVSRGGVFSKSLDRNDSHNINVNWTDGLHAAFRSHNGWTPNLILQRNSTNGPSNVRRGPLDFDDSGARVSYFFSVENLKRTPLFLQRTFDISYLPKSLLKDGDLSGRRKDYYGVVLRSANRWPERDDGPRLRIAVELGYAPETQTRAAAGLAGSGDAAGTAWNISLSLMDLKPNHSVGVNYGQVAAGWLLSPQYRENESAAEIRYQWRKTDQLAFDIRIRKREELEQLVFSDRKRTELDFFLRFTWGRTIR